MNTTQAFDEVCEALVATESFAVNPSHHPKNVCQAKTAKQTENGLHLERMCLITSSPI